MSEDQPGVRRYRHRPVERPASRVFEVTADNVEAVATWIADIVTEQGGDVAATCAGDDARIAWANTEDGSEWEARPGDFVVEQGFRCVSFTAASFHARYEPA